MLGMPSHSKHASKRCYQSWVLKNVFAKSIDIYSKKKTVHSLDSNPRLPECKSAALTIELYGCGFRWNVARVFFVFKWQADHRTDSWWHTWRRRMMGLWCKAVDMVILTVPGELTAWQTDRRTGFQLYI